MKLLDEKGLTTVWAAIKNTFTSKSDADGKYAKKSEAATHTSAGVMTPSDKIKLDGIAENANNYSLPLAANGTLGGIQLGHSSISTGDRFYYPLRVDGDQKAYVSIPYATSGTDGLMTSEDKDKLNSIDHHANNYTLPTASDTTLGGIKTGFVAKNEVDWKVDVDRQGNAYVSIGGLHSDSKGKIGYIDIEGNNIYTPATRYRNNGISSGLPGKQANFTFPSESGTLALASDIPNVSNLCKINFVDRPSNCVEGRINMFTTTNRSISLNNIENYGEGLILLLGCYSESQYTIYCTDSDLYYEDVLVDSGYKENISKNGMYLVTIKGSSVYVYPLN